MVCLKIPGRRFLPIEAAVVTLLISPGSAGLAWADTASDRVTRLTRPHSTVDLGVGYLFNDGARFGQYSGMRDAGPYGLINADILNRSDATGTWFKLRGRNLGLDNRELR
ncbi:MAG: MtrB/PioB family outer membrane beta-barrel protein, partial [Nitrosospira sp.]|nr:MtrB/PioB family outer membrane beta-barrel protein [Nitrosospira sp.]